MVSKNNHIKRMEEAAERQSHFGIRKLTVGAASVLLGTSLWMGANSATVHADTSNNEDKDITDESHSQKVDSSVDTSVAKKAVVQVQSSSQDATFDAANVNQNIDVGVDTTEKNTDNKKVNEKSNSVEDNKNTTTLNDSQESINTDTEKSNRSVSKNTENNEVNQNTQAALEIQKQKAKTVEQQNQSNIQITKDGTSTTKAALPEDALSSKGTAGNIAKKNINSDKNIVTDKQIDISKTGLEGKTEKASLSTAETNLLKTTINDLNDKDNQIDVQKLSQKQVSQLLKASLAVQTSANDDNPSITYTDPTYKYAVPSGAPATISGKNVAKDLITFAQFQTKHGGIVTFWTDRNNPGDNVYYYVKDKNAAGVIHGTGDGYKGMLDSHFMDEGTIVNYRITDPNSVNQSSAGLVGNLATELYEKDLYSDDGEGAIWATHTPIKVTQHIRYLDIDTGEEVHPEYSQTGLSSQHYNIENAVLDIPDYTYVSPEEALSKYANSSVVQQNKDEINTPYSGRLSSTVVGKYQIGVLMTDYLYGKTITTVERKYIDKKGNQYVKVYYGTPTNPKQELVGQKTLMVGEDYHVNDKNHTAITNGSSPANDNLVILYKKNTPKHVITSQTTMKTVNETVNYKYEGNDGSGHTPGETASPTYRTSLTFNGTAYLDETTGKYVTGPDSTTEVTNQSDPYTWVLKGTNSDNGTFNSVTSPAIDNFTITRVEDSSYNDGNGNVKEVPNINHNSNDVEVTVWYKTTKPTTPTYKATTEEKSVTRTINYYDKVTGQRIPQSVIDKSDVQVSNPVTETATFTRSTITDNNGKFIGYGTVNSDGTSYRLNNNGDIGEGWVAKDGTTGFLIKNSPDLTAQHYTAPTGGLNATAETPDNGSRVASWNISPEDLGTSRVYNIYYGHETQPIHKTETVERNFHYIFTDSDVEGKPGNGSTQTYSKAPQTVTFKGDGTKDLLTGEESITWTPESDTLEHFTPEEIPGYKLKYVYNDGKSSPVSDGAVEIKVDPTSKDHSATFIYDPDQNLQKAKVTIVDITDKDNPQPAKTLTYFTNYNGESDKSIIFTVKGAPSEDADGSKQALQSYLNSGYEFVKAVEGTPIQDLKNVSDITGTDIGGASSIDYGKFNTDTSDVQNFTIYLAHKFDTNTEKGTTTSTVHYIVEGNKPDKPAAPKDDVQTVNWTKTDKTDLVTGTVTRGDWTTETPNYKDVPTPELAGYTESTKNVPGEKTEYGKNPYTVVTYSPVDTPVTPQKATVEVIDKTNNKVLGSFENPHGTSGAKISFDGLTPTVQAYLNNGYKYVNAEDTTNGTKEITYNPADGSGFPEFDDIDNNTQSFKIYLDHNEKTEKVPSTAKVHYIMSDGTKAPDDSPTQTITFTNVFDAVTGEVKSSTPDKDSFTDVKSPDVKGYTPNQTNVSFAKPVAGQNQVINVIYTPQAPDIQHASLKIVDKTANKTLIDGLTADGNSGTQISFPSEKSLVDTFINAGYKFDSAVNDADNSSIGDSQDSIKFPEFDNDASKSQDFTIYLVHDTAPVDPEHPGAGYAKSDLDKTVTRTINYLDEQGNKIADSKTETVEFKGSGIVDKVTNKFVKSATDLTPLEDQSKGITWTKTVDGKTSDGNSYEFASTQERPNIEFNSNDYIFNHVDKKEYDGGSGSVKKYEVSVPDNANDLTVNVIYSLKPADTTYHYAATPEEKTVTRTINYYDKQTGEKIPADLIKDNPTTQTAKITRQVVLDNNNKIVGHGTISEDGKTFTPSDDWTTDDKSWAEVKSPDLSSHGYTAPDKEKVAHETVDGNTKDQTINVYYDHTYVPVTPDDPKKPTDPVNPDDPQGPKYPEGLTKEDLEKTVTRNIHYVGVNDDGTTTAVNGAPDGKSDYTQSVTFTKHAIVDKVTGKIVGYDTDNDGKADTQDATRAWMPNSASFDQVDSQTPASVQDKDGKKFDSVDIPTVSSTSVLPDSKFQDITVTYRHTPQTPVTTYKATDETKDVTRTITYKDSVTGQDIPSSLAEPQTQKVTLHRDRITDNNGNFVGYGKVSADGKTYTVDSKNPEGWNTGDWAEVKSPDLSSHGYTAPDKEKVDHVTVTGDTQDANVVVYYGHQTIPVKPDDPKKPTDPVNPSDPDGPKYPDGVDETSLNKTVTRTINYVDDEGNKVNGAPDGTSQEVEHVNFTRTAIVDKVTGDLLGYDTNGDGKADTQDGDRAWNPVSGSFKEVASKDPKEVGYDTVDKTSVAGQTVAPSDKDMTVTVVYSKTPAPTPAEDTTGSIKYIDDTTGQTLKSDSFKGKVGEKISYTSQDKITDYENMGYKLVSNNFTDGKEVYNEDASKNNFEVHLVHDTVPVNPDNPGEPDKPINPNDPRDPKDQPKYPSGSSEDDLQKTITRTVHYEGADQYTPNDVKQPVNFTAKGVLDKVTGKWTTPLTWSSDQTVAAVTTPQIPGYHVKSVDKDSTDGKNVNASTIKHGDNDYTVTVVYEKDPTPTAETTTGKVVYHDDTTNKDLRSDDLSGEVGTNITYTSQDKINNFVNQGYVFVSSDYTDGTEIFDKDASKNNFIIHLKHGTTPVDPNNPGEPDKPINPNDPRDPKDQPKYPNGTSEDDLQKTITRTIHYQGAGEYTPEDVKQPVNFTAKGVLDKVTGKWTTPLTWSEDQEFSSKNSPKIPGYHVVSVDKDSTDNTNVDSAKTSHDGSDYTVNVTYAPDEKAEQGSLIVKFHDDTDGVDIQGVGTNTGDVETGTKVTYNSDTDLHSLEERGYEYVSTDGTIPAEITKGNTVVTIHVKHTTRPVTPDKPVDPDHPVDPNHPDNPSNKNPQPGLAKTDLEKTLTRNIKYIFTDGTKPDAHGLADQTQTVNFHGEGTIDLVTGNLVTIDKDGNITGKGSIVWTSDNDKMAEVAAHKVDGYYISGTINANDDGSVNGLTVNPTDTVQDATIIYTPNAKPAPTDQLAHLTIIDRNDAANPITMNTYNNSGKENTAISFNGSQDYVQDLIKRGYILDGFKAGNGAETKLNSFNDVTFGNFDNDPNTDQAFTLYLVHGTTTVTPDKPGHPGDPVDPTNPSGPKYPSGTDEHSVKRVGTQTVHYVGAGDKTPEDAVQTTTFTRTITFDNVTGKIVEDSGWNENSHKFDEETTPVVQNYHADKATAGGVTVTPDDLNKTVVVTYTPNGHIVPVDPEGNHIPGTDTPTFPTDPKDPTKVDTGIVPNVPDNWTPTSHKPGDNINPDPKDPGKDVPVPFNPVTPAPDQGSINVIVHDVTDNVDLPDYGKTSGSQDVGTKFDYNKQTTVSDLENKGYKVINPEVTIPGEITKGNTNVTIYVEHNIVPVNPDNPGKPGEPINPNDPDGPKWPSDTDKDSLTKTGTQTVHYTGAGEDTPKDSVTTVTFTHSMTIDKVTGKTTDNGWTPSTQTYQNIGTPTIPGYTADQVSAGGETVKATDGKIDREYTVHYTKNAVVENTKGSVTYIDDTDNGRTMETANFGGQVGDKIDYTTSDRVSYYEGLGYKLVGNNPFKDGEQTYVKDPNGNTFQLHFVHDTTPVNPDNPGAGYTKDDLDKTITRTVTYVYTDGTVAPQPQVQKVHFTGSGTYDKVTHQLVTVDKDGKITPGGQITWTPENSSFEEVPGFNLNGYYISSVKENGTNANVNMDNASVSGEDVTHNSTDSHIIITLTKKPETPVAANGSITYIDDTTGNVLEGGNFSGVVGQNISYTTKDRITHYESMGYKLVSNNFDDGKEVFTNGENKFEVHLAHLTTPVTPDKPGKPGEPVDPNNPDGPKYPDNYQPQNLTKTVTRDVTYVYTDGSQAQSPVHQEVKFNGNGVVDLVTGRLVIVDKDGNVTGNGDITWTPEDSSFEEVPGIDTTKYNIVGVKETNTNANVDNTGKIASETVTPKNNNSSIVITMDKKAPVENAQKASLTIIDRNDPANPITMGSYSDSGMPNSAIAFDGSKSFVDQLLKKGYVIDGYKAGNGAESKVDFDTVEFGKFDNDDNTDQTFTLYLKHTTTPVTPDKPGKPGEPVDPNNPDGPKYPQGTSKDDLTKSATQTVIYHYSDGSKADETKTVTVPDAFTRTIVFDNVTGQFVNTGSWTGSHSFNGVNTPVVNGYHADKKTAGEGTATVDNPTITDVVTYTPNGKIVPVDPEGNHIPGTDTPTFPTDPKDPTKVDTGIVPNVPDNWTPKDPNNKPGSNITPDPKDPGKDVPVPFNPVTPTPDKGSITVIVHDNTTGKDIPDYGKTSGSVDAGTKFTYDKTTTITDLENKGYKVVNPEVTIPGEVAKGNTNVTIYVEHDTVPVNPTNPGKPGEPINPNDPYGPKWPSESGNVSKDVTRTITFVDNNGKEVHAPVEQTVHFTAQGVMDKVTGKWTTPLTWSSDQTVNGQNVPFVENYHVTSISKDGEGTSSIKSVTLNHDSDSYKVVVSYEPNGHIVPVDPNGNKIPNVDNPTYPTDPNNPAKVTPNEPVPSIPGYTPEVPTVTPDNPGEDTPVIYTPIPADKGQVIVKVHDNTTGKDVPDYGYNSGEQEVGQKVDYNKNEVITNLTNKGYKVINPDVTIPSDITKGSQVVTIYVEHDIVPVNPTNPGKPGEPINPNDPNGPKWPSDTDKDSLTKTGTQTVHYTGAGDNTPKDSVTTVTFEHHLVIDKVTGKVVKDEGWTPNSQTYNKINTPVIEGYTADKSVVGGDTVTSSDNNINREYTVTYTAKTTPVTPVTPTPEPSVTTVVGKQTITFVDGDNNNTPLRDSDVQTHTFTITDGVPSENSYTFGTVNVPVIKGYVAEIKTAGGKTVTPNDPNAEVVVVYHKIGKIVPVDPDHNPIPGAETPQYKNDPEDPTKVVPDENVPIIDGYTPSQNTVTPTDPTEDTEVVYTKKTTPVEPDEPDTPDEPDKPTRPKKHRDSNKPKPSTPKKTNNYNYNNAPHAQNGYWNNNVAPHGQTVNGWSNNIGPHGEHVDANGNIVAPNGEIIGYVDKNGNPHYTKQLPQTGEKQTDTAAALLGGAAAGLSLIGLAGVKKRRKKD
ncbi:YSIRK-type signal peptide-containing protein [Lactobacillus sp. LL6]|uniref:mucin-binding protein n=1 Tax=Lactobacillus sp. LL6 TaxID=2596827 RepID=UPI0011868B4D|nr:YSIRK-type signal peptide-containing protein [Lactobacillus sp. LL6]TSO25505.1 YSIRK-type signal peptide-containing protein [Lactobacillus sp. LL6]